MKAFGICWDVDNTEDLELLPTEVEIPDDIVGIFDPYDETEYDAMLDKVSDYLSDTYGFCHRGFRVNV